ncbi:hypothetical protein ACFL2Y_00445 [Candidatus Omnitrophota bacterium]
MKVIRLIVCLIMLLMSSAIVLNPSTAFAKQKDQRLTKKEEVVYVTRRGKKYHKETCPFIKNRETVSTSPKEAEEKGLKPCGRCHKEEETE